MKRSHFPKFRAFYTVVSENIYRPDHGYPFCGSPLGQVSAPAGLAHPGLRQVGRPAPPKKSNLHQELSGTKTLRFVKTLAFAI